MQFQAAGFDLRQVENIVDEGKQVPGPAQDMVQLPLLFLIQVAGFLFRQQLREPNDGMQGCP